MTLLARVLIFYPGQRAGILEEITHLTRQCMDRRNFHELDRSLWFFPQFIFLPVLNSSVDQLLLAVINWPKTKTLRQQLAVSRRWNIWFEGYCRAIDGYCHAIDDVGGCHVNVLSPPCLVLGKGNRASVIVFRWLEVIAIVNERRKVIALAEDKTFSRRYAWPSI